MTLGAFFLAGAIAAPQDGQAQWLGWENLGGITLEDSSCVSWGPNRIDCFARGTNAAMFHRWWNGSSWGGWENLGGVILEAPECVSWGPNRIDCFARGTNQAMFHRWWNGSSWGGWENLGGVILDKPNCVSWGPNRIDCFARGTNRAMYHRWWNGSSWGGWENLGGVLLDAPECVSWGPNRIDCFARGTNRAMYHRWWNGSSWNGWENLSGEILDKPNCVSWGPNRIDCFARGTNAAMYHRWWNGSSWGGWENLGGVILEEPKCVSWGPNRIDCFARGTNAAMFHRWWNGSNWGGWDNLGGVILDRPECVSWSQGRLDCFARGTNRALFHRWYNSVSVTSRPLTISRHNTATLTNADADSILADASSVLQTNDGDGDVACNVALARSGNVTVFNNTDGSLDTSNELQTVFGLPGNVKVVNDVNFCANQFNTSFIGCGQTPGPSFIVERFTANQEGILWAHEFGHNQGLPHRDTTTDNVMFRSIGTNRRRVNQGECNSFVGSAGMTVAAVFETMPTQAREVEEPMMQLAMGEEAMGGMPDSGEDMPDAEGEAVGMGEDGRAGDSEVEQDVVAFVSQIYFHGLPLDEAAQFGSEDVGTLIDMLNDPEQVLYHENVALTLGMIGDPAATEALIAYIEQGSGAVEAAAANEDLARRDFKGRVGAMMGLGYLVNRADDDTALEYLIDSTAPTAWQDRDVEGMSMAPGTDGAEDLTKYAIFALGVSGSEEAREHLQSLIAGDAESLAAVGDDGADIVRQSLQINEEVSREGLVEYYSDEH